MNTDICDKCETVRHCMNKGCIPLTIAPTVYERQINMTIDGAHKIIPVNVIVNKDGKVVEVCLRNSK